MTTPFYRAVGLVVSLMKTTGMSLINACRIAAFETGVDSDRLYRELTQ